MHGCAVSAPSISTPQADLPTLSKLAAGGPSEPLLRSARTSCSFSRQARSTIQQNALAQIAVQRFVGRRETVATEAVASRMPVIEALLRGLGSAAEQSACPATAWSRATTRAARANDDGGSSVREVLHAFAVRQEANVGRRRQNLLQRVVDLPLSPYTVSSFERALSPAASQVLVRLPIVLVPIIHSRTVWLHHRLPIACVSTSTPPIAPSRTFHSLPINSIAFTPHSTQAHIHYGAH